METGFKVLDAMTKMPIIVLPNITVTQAAKTMMQHGVGSLLIVEGDHLKGIVTEVDFTYRVIAKSLPPDKTKVSDVMTTDVISLAPDMDIYDALVQMNNFDIRHAPRKISWFSNSKGYS
jgi:signal-transduction protein with cAMP-binding, CBS, and nucleotidyltransferase domain